MFDVGFREWLQQRRIRRRSFIKKIKHIVEKNQNNQTSLAFKKWKQFYITQKNYRKRQHTMKRFNLQFHGDVPYSVKRWLYED